MNSIILARGEKSKRLNLDKAFIEIKGKKLIEIILNKLKPIFKNIYIVTPNPKKFGIYQDRKVKVIKDKIDKGPLGGIYIGLLKSTSLYNFVFAVDMPFINDKFIKYMMKKKKDYDVLVPFYNNKLEVLHAIYNKNVLAVIEKKLNEKNYKVKEILKEVKTRYVKEDEIKKFNTCKPMFLNLNTYKDIKLFYQLSRGVKTEKWRS